ncbi:MAG: hypothetical protein R6W91_05090, partial [Thermoplasmata archaeon]
MDFRKLSSAMIAMLLISMGFSMMASDSADAEFIVQLSNNGLSPDFVALDTEWNAAGTMAIVVGYDTAGGPNAYVYYMLNDTYVPIDNGGNNGQRLYSVDYFREEVYGWPDGTRGSIWDSILGVEPARDLNEEPMLQGESGGAGSGEDSVSSAEPSPNPEPLAQGDIGMLPTAHSATPSSFDFTVLQGQTDSDIMAIDNLDLVNPMDFQIKEPVQKTFGSFLEQWQGANRDRGNVYQVATSTTLSMIEFYLTISTSTQLYFFVYEGPTLTGTYNEIFEISIPNSGTGTGWYSSGPINVNLIAGNYYYIGTAWIGDATTTYGRSTTPGVISTSFGSLITGQAYNLAYNPTPPPPLYTTINQLCTSGQFAPYYQRLTTLNDTLPNWLSVTPMSGTIAPGGQALCTVEVDTTALGLGFYQADIPVTEMNPLFPTTYVQVDLTVTSYDVALSPAFQADFGLPNNNVNHTLTVSNTGIADDTYDLTVQNNAWPVTFRDIGDTVDITSIFVGAGMSEDILVRVSIPPGASPGVFDLADINAISRGEPSIHESARVRTQVPFNLPWFDALEDDVGGWTAVDLPLGNGIPWHLNASNSHSPTHGWRSAFDGVGTYANGMRINCILRTPTLNFTGFDPGSVMLSFYERYLTEAGWDFTNIVYSSDNGGTWNWIPARNNVTSGTSAGYPAWNLVSYLIPGPYTNRMKIGFHF